MQILKCGKGKIMLYGHSFIAHAKIEDIWKDVSEDVEKRFDTSNYEADRPLPMGKKLKSYRANEDELRRQIIKKFVGLRPKTYSY